MLGHHCLRKCDHLGKEESYNITLNRGMLNQQKGMDCFSRILQVLFFNQLSFGLAPVVSRNVSLISLGEYVFTRGRKVVKLTGKLRLVISVYLWGQKTNSKASPLIQTDLKRDPGGRDEDRKYKSQQMSRS